MEIEVPENVVVGKLDPLANWCRKNSLWPMPPPWPAAHELMATEPAGMTWPASSGGLPEPPRQCDLMIVAGRVVMKMLPVLQRIWLQMPEPSGAFQWGSRSLGIFDIPRRAGSTGSSLWIVRSRLPDAPEQLIQSIIDLQDKIQREGTVTGKEFLTPERQLEKLALLEILPGEIMPRPKALEIVSRN
jgi:NADH-quinone oxidoreductase subunit B